MYVQYMCSTVYIMFPYSYDDEITKTKISIQFSHQILEIGKK